MLLFWGFYSFCLIALLCASCCLFLVSFPSAARDALIQSVPFRALPWSECVQRGGFNEKTYVWHALTFIRCGKDDCTGKKRLAYRRGDARKMLRERRSWTVCRLAVVEPRYSCV
ncbi:hypothetical protein IWZ03DRAFT_138457 [Phyllosticta citriasiana]|uniref:Secreted protein n=1 Tax=Phyllosticta citriasiana TaxID=595635 RepID=A0ABR1KV62_9PEZI